MAIRLIVTITAAAGKGSELAQGYKARCAEVMEEPGCEQFEVFQSVEDHVGEDPPQGLEPAFCRVELPG